MKITYFGHSCFTLASPSVVIPMHYRVDDKGFAELSKLKTFLNLCTDVRVESGNSLELSKDVVLTTCKI